jgi:hypothetical protein
MTPVFTEGATMYRVEVAFERAEASESRIWDEATGRRESLIGFSLFGAVVSLLDPSYRSIPSGPGRHRI